MCMTLKNPLKLKDQQPPVQIQNNSSQFCNLNPHGQQNQSNNYSMEFDQHQQPPVQKQTTT